MLSQHLEKTGQVGELVDLMRDQLSSARDSGDRDKMKVSSLHLGAMLASSGETDEAIQIYRSALDNAGDDAELLSALLSALGPEHDAGERASLSERLLALEEGDAAATLALSLTDLYRELGDEGGALRALEAGIERAPGNADIRGRLEEHYRQTGDFHGLARVLESASEGCEDPARKLELLREAAAVHRDQLGDPGRAIGMLQAALELAPDDGSLWAGLASSQAASGDSAAALETLGQALERAEDDAGRLSLLRARAGVRSGAEDEAGALEDLEAAYAIDAEAVGAELVAALEQRRTAAADADDYGTERDATLRAIEVMVARGERIDATELLTAWTERAPEDVDALRMLRDMDAADDRWENVARTCDQLIQLETGDEQVSSAATLLHACSQLGNAEHARAALEHVWQQQPDNADIRGHVRQLYETIGAHRELATMLLQDAEAMDDDEQKVANLLWAAETLQRMGDVQAAEPALQQVLELKPGNAHATCLLSDAHVMMGRYDEANALLDDAIGASRRNSPDLHLYHHRKAYLAAAQGDPQGQLECLKKAHQVARKNGSIAAELADLAEQQEDWDLAAKTLRSIATLDGDCPITPAYALLRQGRIALHLGDKKRALLCGRRASLAEPENAEIQAFMTELGEG
jgi:thioredoxin-like negative regulator of GroEL